MGAKTEVEQMIGNAVPPELARFVGEGLRDYLEERRAERAPRQRSRRRELEM